jgi:hypothetical protein
MNIKKGIFWIALVSIFFFNPFVFLCLFLIFYTNRYTRIFIKNKIYDFYGLDQSEREELIRKSDEIWAGFWRRFANNLIGGRGGSSSMHTKGPAQMSDLRHRKVGYCQGWNVSATSKSSHYLYKCGKCGHAGCSDSNCPNSSFSGNTCKLCNQQSNFTG